MQELNLLIERWEECTDTVLQLEPLSLRNLQPLLRDTYAALSHYAQKDLVPKEVAKLFLCMEDFLYLASVMEENEKGKGFYCWEELHCLVSALKKGFFAGGYTPAYPELRITDCLDNDFLLDVENDALEGYVTVFRRVRAQPM